MNKTKCKGCGLVNLTSDMRCRRCGEAIGRPSSSPTSPREAAKKSTWLYTILFLTVVGGAAYYIVSGVEDSYKKVTAGEADRAATQAKQQPFTNRTEADQKRVGTYQTAIQNSNGLSAVQKHNEETKKLMEQQK